MPAYFLRNDMTVCFVAARERKNYVDVAIIFVRLLTFRSNFGILFCGCATPCDAHFGKLRATKSNAPQDARNRRNAVHTVCK